MIPLLDYYGDNLANVGLPEAWLEWGSNCVIEIFLLNFIYKKNYESNPVKKRESHEVKQGVSNEIKHVENNQVSHRSQCGTADVDDGASVG